MKTSKIKVAFLIHNASTFDALYPVYKEMIRQEDAFCVKVFSLPHDYMHRGNFIGEDVVATSLQERGIKCLRPYADNYAGHLARLKAFAPDYIFRQSPWERDIPPEFGVNNLSFARLCYIQYGFLSLREEEELFARPFHQACWRIFCEMPEYLDLYRKSSPKGDSNVTCTGYPKFEMIMGRKQEKFWPLPVSKNSLKVIWAPHHSITGSWLGYSTFLSNHSHFLELAKANPEISLVMRPHPAMFDILNRYGFGEGTDKYLADFNALPNTAIYTKGDFIPLFWGSDMMITDGIGFFAEYIVTRKPMIFTDAGRSSSLNAVVQNLLTGMYRAKDFNAVCESLQLIVNGKDNLAEKREELASSLFNPQQTMPSAKIVAFLRDNHQSPN